MKKNKILAKIALSILALLLLNLNLLPYIKFNGGEEGYNEGDVESIAYGNSIKYYIEKGGSYYLSGYSDILSFLERIESSGLNGLDYIELNRILDGAIEKMKNADYNYMLLIVKAECTPYNRSFIDRLIIFDYPGFESAYHLNSVVFAEVEEFLKKGDITGAFKACRSNIRGIITMLGEIKGFSANNRMPGLPLVWSLNELCSDTLLFGQYAARVFADIKQK